MQNYWMFILDWEVSKVRKIILQILLLQGKGGNEENLTWPMGCNGMNQRSEVEGNLVHPFYSHFTEKDPEIRLTHPTQGPLTQKG